MASYANTTLSGITIDLLWDMKTLEARYANAVIMPHVLNKSSIVAKHGEQVGIPIKAALTVGSVGSGGSFTPAAPAPTVANVTLNTWVQVSIEIDDQAKAQSFWDPTSDFPIDAGKALAVNYDTSLAGQFSSISGLTAVGDPLRPEAFNDGSARTALLRLANANIPKEDLSFFLPPVAWYAGWLTKVELTAAYATGLPKSLMTSGQRTPILGVPTYETNVLSKDGSSFIAALLHKESLAIAFQLNHKYKIADRISALNFSTVAATNSLYGRVVVRNNHGVRIYVRDS